MTIKLDNLAIAYLASAPASGGSIAVQTGKGALFPEVPNGARAVAVLEEPSTGVREIVHITFHTAGTDTFAVTRGAEGSTISALFTTSSIFRLVASKYVIEAALRRKNRLINGCLRLWEYGTSHASPVDGTFVANRWRVGYTGTAGTSTISRVTMTLGEWEYDGAPKYLLRWNQTVGGTLVNSLRQPIEGVATMAGGKCTISFLGKCATGTVLVEVRATQHFGTGGAPSSDVAAAGNATLTTTLTKHQVTVDLATIAGKTLGSSGTDHLLISLHFPSGGTWDVHLGQLQAEATPIATDFERRGFSEEQNLAARYFFKTFNDDTAPAQNAGMNGSIGYVAAASGAAGYAVHVRFPVPMRAQPTLTFYNPAAANALWHNFSTVANSGTPTGLGTTLSNRAVSVYNPGDAADVAGNGIVVHMTASAEL